MADSGEPMMFSIDGVEQPNPVIASVGKASPYSLEIVSKKFLYVKLAAKTVSSDIMFCLPKEGGTISDLMVVKVNEPGRDTPRDERLSVHPFYDAGKFRQSSGRDRPRNEKPVLEQIQAKMPEHYCYHFPEVKEYNDKEGWLAMTAYNHSITLEDFVNHCASKEALPTEFLVVLLSKLTKIYQTLENEKIGHGDIRAHNILLQISPDVTNAFPYIRIVDFNRESSNPNLSGFVPFMWMMAEPLLKRDWLNQNWNSFKAKVELWRGDIKGVGYLDLERGLEELIREMRASEQTISTETQILFQEIADLKLRNNLWVTEEDINNAVVKAGDKVHETKSTPSRLNVFIDGAQTALTHPPGLRLAESFLCTVSKL